MKLYISKIIKNIGNRDDVIDVKFEDLQVWFHNIFDTSNVFFFEILKKIVFEKSFFKDQGFQKRLAWLGVKCVYNIRLNYGNQEFPLDSSVRVTFPQN